jgi:hypothetical protein
MKLSDFKKNLNEISHLNFVLPSGEFVPSHFHITEAGLITKNYIDCGGTSRSEKHISFQLWTADDHEHRLQPNKLNEIISIYEKLFGSEDLDVEMEYQSQTIGRYGLDFKNGNFFLVNKFTDCLAKDGCGIPSQKEKIKLSELQSTACCTPGSKCC